MLLWEKKFFRLATLFLTPMFYVMAAEKENLKNLASRLRSCCCKSNSVSPLDPSLPWSTDVYLFANGKIGALYSKDSEDSGEVLGKSAITKVKAHAKAFPLLIFLLLEAF